MQLFLLLLIQYLWQSQLYRSRLVGHTEPSFNFCLTLESLETLRSLIYSVGLGLATTAPFNGFIRIFTEFEYFSTITHLYYMCLYGFFQNGFWDFCPFCVLYHVETVITQRRITCRTKKNQQK